MSLDPATLTLNLDPGVFGPRAGPVLNDCFEAACSEDPWQCANLLRAYPNSVQGDIHAAFISSVWHEKRHFLDLTLTNYGAFRMRQFFQVYLNVPLLLNEARHEGGNIFCPIQSYLDPVQRKVHNLRDRPLLHEVAKASQTAQRILNEDFLVPSGIRQAYHFGGEGQLEALAYYCQIAASQAFLGQEGSKAIFREFQRTAASESKYNWATFFGAGQWPEVFRQQGEARLIDVTLLMPLLFASLLIRSWGQTKTIPRSDGSLLPSNRIAYLARELGGANFASVEEAWGAVDQRAQRLWGRSLMDELETDYQLEERMVESVQKNEGIPTLAAQAYADYHALRGRLIALFREDHTSVLEPTAFAVKLLPRLRPLAVLTSAAGVVGEPPDGAWRVYGYHDPDSKLANAKWYWSAMFPDWPKNPAGDLAMKAPNVWRDLMSDGAPLAKILLNGFRHRTAIGPELVFGHRRTSGALGVSLHIAGSHAYPREDTREVGRTFRLYRPDAVLTCDACRSTIKSGGEFHTFSPWFFRHNDRTFRLMHDAYGGDEEATLRSWRDWSYWIMCPECTLVVMGVPGAREAWLATTMAPFPENGPSGEP